MPLIDTYAVLGCGSPCSKPFGRSELMQRMDTLGITHSIVASSIAISSDFEAGNAWLAEQISGERRLLGYAVANTNHPEQSIEEIRKYMTKRQFVGLILLEGDEETPISSDDSYEILNAYRRYGKPLLVPSYNRECVHGAAQIAKSFNQMRVALVGMGGYDWQSAIAAVHAHLNIFLMTNGEVSPDKIEAGWKATNGNRIMFASGAPKADPAVMLGMIAETGLKERQMEQLLSGNAERTYTG